MKKRKLSRRKSDRIYSGFLKWREKLLDIENAVIIVEGKRDEEVLNKIGVNNKSTVKIIQYSQTSIIQFNENFNNNQFKIIPLVDFDFKGNEYLNELKQYKQCDLELRNNLYSLTNGHLIEFEDLLKYLNKNLHPSYWINLQELL